LSASNAAAGTDRAWIAWAILLPLLTAISALLWLQADGARILEDTLQHIGVARNLLRGEGLSTSLLYYDVQYAPAAIPAPQTVWPPGITLAIASGLAVGLQAEAAALLLGWLGFAVAAVALVAVLARAGVTPAIAGLAAAVWAVSSVNWVSAAIAASELPYVACLLLATAALVPALAAGRGFRLLALAGLAAAAAVGMRYMGVFFVVAAGCVVLVSPRADWRQRIFAGTAFGVLPAVAVAALVTRNFLATGHLSGGQFGVADGLSLPAAVLRGWWSTVELFALPRDGAAATPAQLVLLAVLGLAALGIARFVFVRRAAEPAESLAAQRALLAVALAYCGLTALLHVAWATSINEGMLDSRYLEPLLPFVCIVLALAANDVYRRSGNVGKRVTVACFALLGAGYSVPQWQHWDELWPGYGSVVNERDVARALATPFAGTTAGQWLKSTGVGPVVSTLEHAVQFQVDHPVLGLPDSRYTATTWDEQTVHELMTRYGACVVFFIPHRFPLNPRSAVNLQLFQSLAAKQPPSWLEPLLVTPDVELYGVAESGRCAALTAPSR
jgi:hypothetical protein